MQEPNFSQLLVLAQTAVDHIMSLFMSNEEPRVHWFDDESSRQMYLLDPELELIAFNRAMIRAWGSDPAAPSVEQRMAGLSARAAGDYLLQPDPGIWSDVEDAHFGDVADTTESGYIDAFRAARRILEAQRIDSKILEVLHASEELEALVELDLEQIPTFDVYPRAAVLMGRVGLPYELAAPALREFREEFGPTAWDELGWLISDYRKLDSDDFEEMVQLIESLVEVAFPEAVGLSYDDGEDSWELSAQILEGEGATWDGLARFISNAIAKSRGHAGMNFGDALMIGPAGGLPVGERVAVWAQGDQVMLDAVSEDLPRVIGTLVDETSWDTHPIHIDKMVPIKDATAAASELVDILKSAGEVSPVGYCFRARGPAARDASEYFAHLEIEGQSE